MTVEMLEKISTALTPLSLIDLTASENLLNKLIDLDNIKDQNALLDLVSKTTWTDSGIVTFKKELKKPNNEFYNNNSLENFIDGMQKLNNTFGQYDAEAVINMAKSMKEASKLTRGDIIEEELYQSLLALNDEVEDYFTLM